jgi:hypothetical protein
MNRSLIRAVTSRKVLVACLWGFGLGLLADLQLFTAILGYLRYPAIRLSAGLFIIDPLLWVAYPVDWAIGRAGGGPPRWWHLVYLASYSCRFALVGMAWVRTIRRVTYARSKSIVRVGDLPWFMVLAVPVLSLTFDAWSPAILSRAERMWAEAVFEDRTVWSTYLAGVPAVVAALGPLLAAAGPMSLAALLIAGWRNDPVLDTAPGGKRSVLRRCFLAAVFLIPPDIFTLPLACFLLGWPGMFLAHRLFRVRKGLTREFQESVAGACTSLALLALAPFVFGPREFEIPPHARDRHHLARAASILARSGGVDRVVARLVERFGPGNDPEVTKRASIALQEIGADAGRVLPQLFGKFPGADRERRTQLLAAFDAIDAGWADRPEAEVLVPGLVELVADVSWADRWEGAEQFWWDTPQFRDVEVFTYRGERLLNETGEGGVALRALEALDRIRPGWRETPEGRGAIARLTAEQRPELIAAMKKWIAETAYAAGVRLLGDDERRRLAAEWGKAPLGRLHAADALLRHIGRGGAVAPRP